MATDVHAHVTVDVPAQLARARAAGVDRTALVATRPHPESATTNAELRAEFTRLTATIGGATPPADVYRTVMDEVLAALRAHPGETVGFVTVPLDLPETDVKPWLSEYFAEPGVVGIGELTPAPDRAHLVEPVLSASADLGGKPVLVHGFHPNTIGDMRTYASLAQRYPSVPIIVTALGGLNALDLIDLAEHRPNLYIDLSSALQVFAVTAAARTVPEQCLFGSNTPYGDVLASRATIEAAVPDPAVRERLFTTNAATIFGHYRRPGPHR